MGRAEPDLVAPLDSLRSLVMSGGKRLRPAFCFWGFRAAGGGDDDAAVIEAGAAFEMLQAFALVHDDIMDGSATRRGCAPRTSRSATATTPRCGAARPAGSARAWPSSSATSPTCTPTG